MRTCTDRCKNDNNGFSLVELIVAIAVGSIVAGAIASLIVITTRMYSKESTNIAGQYEIQTTLNQTVDSAESAQWFALSEEKSGGKTVNTKYVAFGKLTGTAPNMKFEGEIFTDDYNAASPGRFNVYMNRYNSASPLVVGSEADAGAAIATEVSGIKGKKYLLGEGATKYVVSLDTGANRFTDDPSLEAAGYAGYYENPIIFTVSIDFAKDSMTGEIKKHVEDKVTFRNRINRSLYIDGKGYYKLKE